MDTDNQESHHDPQFVKVLETCLKMEIATTKENLDANTEEIKQLKITVRSELKRRKELKEKTAQMNKIIFLLSESLTRLHSSIIEISDSVETMKANADDQYQLIQLRTQEYQNIIDQYKNTWHEYRAIYEEFPLAKARNAAKINLEKLKIEYMVMSYKKAEMMTIIEQRRRINEIRTRCKIIEFANAMLERSKLQEKLAKLKANVKYRRNESQSIKAELQVLHRKKEDKKRQRKEKMLEMAPPKICIPYREMYAQNRAKVQHQWKQVHEPADDTASIDTLFLEELCINEDVALSSEQISIKATRDDNYKLPAIETEISNVRNTVVSKKDTASNAEPSDEKATLTDDDIEMKEIHHEEMQKSQESIKTQPSYRAKDSPLKHNAAKSSQHEVEAKRIRLHKQDRNASFNEITTSQPSIIIKEVDLKFSPPSVPKIKKIESVHYNITMPLMPSKPQCIQRSNVTANSMFSPMYSERCDSTMGSFDQDVMSKDCLTSLCEGSLCNYSSSPISNISRIHAEENARMAFSPKYAAQQNNKIEFDDKKDTSPLQFGNFMEKGNFSLF